MTNFYRIIKVVVVVIYRKTLIISLSDQQMMLLLLFHGRNLSGVISTSKLLDKTNRQQWFSVAILIFSELIYVFLAFRVFLLVPPNQLKIRPLSKYAKQKMTHISKTQPFLNPAIRVSAVLYLQLLRRIVSIRSILE